MRKSLCNSLESKHTTRIIQPWLNPLNDDDENLKSIDKNQENELLNNIEEINDLMNNINENEKNNNRLMIYSVILFLIGQCLIIGGLISLMVS